MKEVITPYCPFPSIKWWAYALKSDVLIFDKMENFQKMSFRNKYCIAGANNKIQLSIPIINGRNQHTPMAEVRIFNEEKWQIKHWRTLIAAYKRTPYFDFYEPELKQLFDKEYIYLIDFNFASFEFIRKCMKVKISISETNTFQKEYPIETIDLRTKKYDWQDANENFPPYFQSFEDRIGFQPNLSIIDLLFSEGPVTKNWICNHFEMQS